MRNLRTFLFLLLSVCLASQARAAQPKTNDDQRIVFITLDGYRWQDLFGGADSALINNSHFVSNIKQTKSQFWRTTAADRRQVLMPFVWDYVKRHGIMIGNRYLGSKMQVANGMHFSYPGYNEDLCGFADDEHVHSNDKYYNPNVSILEVANKVKPYAGSVLAFGSWDVFPYILNEKRSGLEVNAGYRHSLSKNPTATERLLDAIQDESPRHWNSVRYDVFAFRYALEAMKSRHPRFVYIAFGETDDFAHEGHYDEYLKSAHNTDDFIRQLWDYCQQNKFYKGKTTFVISCDHGRGDTKVKLGSWTSHSSSIPGSDETWLLLFGKGIPAKGEVTDGKVYYNKQIAPTIARILGIAFTPAGPNAGTPIEY